MVIATYLWVFGSTVITILGVIHLYLTFFTNRFSSGNEKVVEAMKTSSPIVSTKLTLWKAWIGFNGSHSSGVIFIGVVNLYLALRYFSTLQADSFFFLFTISTIGFYAWLAKKYWFNIPFLGLLVALACFIASAMLAMINK